jgi:hypothetical protein
MPRYTAQQLREILAQHPQAEAVCADTGRVFFASQRVGDHYIPGPNVRAMYRNNPQDAPGAHHCSRSVKRWHLGLPSMGV